MQNQKLKGVSAIAKEIALLFPDALFCGFNVITNTKGKVVKIPISKSGAGVSRDMAEAKRDLVTAKEIIDGIDPLAQYWGVVLQEPIKAALGNEVLTVLDLDAKNSDVPTCTQIKRLINLSKERNLLFETSNSGKGAHIIFMARPDPTLPKMIDLGNGQAVEIFGHPGGSGKSVMLTDFNKRGDINNMQDVRELLTAAGIDVDKKPEAPPPPKPVALQRKYNPSEQYSLARDALEFMNPDMHYDDWVRVGMALVSEFGADGEHLWLEWSQTGQTWDDANIKKAKSFTGSGVGIGTFFHMARDAGWEKPTQAQIERTTANQDFEQFIKKAEAAIEDPAIAIEVAKDLFWKPLSFDLNKIDGTDYLIDGFLAESFSVIAGQPGAGKTTAMIPLALAAAGFSVGDLKSSTNRKIIYVSEDPAQVRRILYSYCKFEGLDINEVSKKFVLIEAKRVNAGILSKLRENVLLETADGVRPWLILDTASATMSLKDENDNSGVAEFVAALKEDIYLGLGASVTIITHTAKAINRNDEDGQARGASAWEGDATLTATLFVDGDIRYLKLRKTRYEPEYREIRFETKKECIAGFDSNNRLQDINLIWTIPLMSDSDIRKNEKDERKRDEAQQLFNSSLDMAHTEFLKYASGFNNPHIQVGAGRRVVPNGIDLLLLDDWLKDSGIRGSGKTETRREMSIRLKNMLVGDVPAGLYPVKVFVP